MGQRNILVDAGGIFVVTTYLYKVNNSQYQQGWILCMTIELVPFIAMLTGFDPFNMPT